MVIQSIGGDNRHDNKRLGTVKKFLKCFFYLNLRIEIFRAAFSEFLNKSQNHPHSRRVAKRRKTTQLIIPGVKRNI